MCGALYALDRVRLPFLDACCVMRARVQLAVLCVAVHLHPTRGSPLQPQTTTQAQGEAQPQPPSQSTQLPQLPSPLDSAAGPLSGLTLNFGKRAGTKGAEGAARASTVLTRNTLAPATKAAVVAKAPMKAATSVAAARQGKGSRGKAHRPKKYAEPYEELLTLAGGTSHLMGVTRKAARPVRRSDRKAAAAGSRAQVYGFKRSGDRAHSCAYDGC